MTVEHAANVGVECRQGNHARCGLVCGCACHRLPRATAKLGDWANAEINSIAERARPLQTIEVPVGLHVVEEAHQ